MTPTPDMPPECVAALRRYIQIQEQMNSLQEEKKSLQTILATHMERSNAAWWYPEIDGQPLKVRFAKTSAVTYDEDTLRQRLGDRYAEILAPDITKIRQHPDEVAAALKPLLSLIGSPSPDKVRHAIAEGRMRREEFAGAFTKVEQRRVTVAKRHSDGPAPE